jgi:hypothetical protein
MSWRLVLLGIVFLGDILVFVDLCRDELRDRRARHGAAGKIKITAAHSY